MSGEGRLKRPNDERLRRCAWTKDADAVRSLFDLAKRRLSDLGTNWQEVEPFPATSEKLGNFSGHDWRRWIESVQMEDTDAVEALARFTITCGHRFGEQRDAGPSRSSTDSTAEPNHRDRMTNAIIRIRQLVDTRTDEFNRSLRNEMGKISQKMVDRRLYNSSELMTRSLSACNKNLQARAEFIKDSIKATCDAHAIGFHAELGDQLKELFDDLFSSQSNEAKSVLERGIPSHIKQQFPAARREPAMDRYRVEIDLYVDRLKWGAEMQPPLEGQSKATGRNQSASNVGSNMTKKHVFLSYCRDNKSEVAVLRDELIAAGEQIWWDQQLLPGQDWKAEIRRAMGEAYAIIACFSKETDDRHESGMFPELRDAIDAYRKYAPGSIFLIPVRLSESSIPEFQIDDTTTLRGLHYVDVFPAAGRAAGLSKLLAALKEVPHRP